MKTTGMVMGLIDVPGEHTKDFNTWYDFDHLPEFVSVPGIIAGRRYVATPDCKAVRPPAASEALADGKGTYCTTYLIGARGFGKLKRDWEAHAQHIRQEHRLFRHGNVVEMVFWRLEFALARNGIPVAAEAVPYLGHTGIMVVQTEVADAARRAEVHQWYQDVHAHDLVALPGIAAAMRFTRVTPPTEGRFMNVYLLDGEPPDIAERINRARDVWTTQGRYPPPGNAAQTLFLSTYRSIVPTKYEFDVG